MSIKSVMPSSHLILCHPLLLLPPIPPSIRVFLMSQLFACGGQSIGVSALASVLPVNTQDGSPSEWTSWISCSLRDSQESSPAPQFKSINSLLLSFHHSPTLTSTYMTTGKTIALIRRTFFGKVMSLLLIGIQFRGSKECHRVMEKGDYQV